MKRILLLLTIVLAAVCLQAQVGTVSADPAIGPGQFYDGSTGPLASTLKPEYNYIVKVNVKNLINSGNIPPGGFTVIIQLGKGVTFSPSGLASLSANYIWSLDNTTDPEQAVLSAALNTTVNHFYNEDLLIPVKTKNTAVLNTHVISGININGAIIGSGNETLNDDAATIYSVFSGKKDAQTNVLCYGAATGSVTLSASGGTVPYQWKKEGGSYGSSSVFSSLAAGSYVFTVQDANNFTDTVMVAITEASEIVPVIVSQQNIGIAGTNCSGGPTGSITLSASGGTGSYLYALDFSSASYQPSGTFNGLSAGAHNISVKDDNGCVKQVPFAILVAPVPPTSGGNITECALATVQTITATATPPSGSTIVWYSVAAGGSIVASPVLSTIGTITYYAASKNTSTGCESLTRTAVTLTLNATPAAPTNSGDIAACAQSPLQTLNASNAVNAGTGYSIVWYTTAAGSTTTATPTLSAVGTVTYYAALKNTSTGCESSARTPVTLTIKTRPASSITGSATLCSGTPATISIAVTGTGPWSGTLQNGTSFSGSNNPIVFPVTTPSSTTYTVATLTDATGCSALPEDNLGTVVISINTVTAGTVAGTHTICNSSLPAAFTQTIAATGAGTLSYQWQSSTDNVLFSDINGAATAVYTETVALTQTTYYRRMVTSTLNGVTCTATGNTLTVAANSISAGVIGGNQVMCNGNDPAAFTSTTAGSGAGTITYSWQSKTVGGTWANISGATGATYDAPAITETRLYRRIAVSTLNSVNCEAISNELTLTVNSINPGSIDGNPTICYGNNPGTFISVAPATGAGTIAYQWERSGNAVTWTAQNGAIDEVYHMPPSSIMTTYFRRVATSSISGSVCQAVSNQVVITVNYITAGTIQGNETLCSGTDAGLITSTAAGTGQTGGIYTYYWEQSPNGTAGSWSTVNGAAGATYDPPVLTTTTYYRRVYTGTLNGSTCTAYGTLPVIIKTVTQRPASIISGTAPVCSGTASTLTVALTGASPWNFSINGTPYVTTNPSFTVPVSPTATTNYTVSGLTDAACTATAADMTGTALVTVNPLSVVSKTSGTNVTCSGGSNGTLTVKGTIGNAPFQFRINGGTPVTGDANDQVLFTGLAAGSHSVQVTDNNGCTATSNFTVDGPGGTTSDISLGFSTYLTSLPTASSSADFMLTLSEVGGFEAAGTKIYIANIDGYTVSLTGGTTINIGQIYTTDNTRWSVSTSGGYTVLQLNNAADVISCSGTLNLGLKITRNGPPAGFFTINAIVSGITGETNISNNKAVRKFTSN